MWTSIDLEINQEWLRMRSLREGNVLVVSVCLLVILSIKSLLNPHKNQICLMILQHRLTNGVDCFRQQDWLFQRAWILNGLVRGRVSSSSTSFWTPPKINFYSVLHLWLKVWRCPTLPAHPICIKYQDENNNILGIGHFQTLSQRYPMLQIKVRSCPESRPWPGNSSLNWAV